MSVLNARIYKRSIEDQLNRANRRVAAQTQKGTKTHKKADHFTFPKHAQRFDPNAGGGGKGSGEASVA
jgi:hypothetical protein